MHNTRGNTQIPKHHTRSMSARRRPVQTKIGINTAYAGIAFAEPREREIPARREKRQGHPTTMEMMKETR